MSVSNATNYSNLSFSGNTLSGSITVAAGETATITYSETIAANTSTGTITNSVSVGDETASASLTGTTPTASIGVSKSAVITDGSSEVQSAYEEGDTVTYTFTVSNNGAAESINVTVSDPTITGIDYKTYDMTSSLSGSKNTASNVDCSSGLSLTLDILAADETVTITLTGTVNADASGNIKNTVTADNQSANVTITEDTSGLYSAEKWIVDSDGNTMVDSSGNIVDSSFDGYQVGDTITFRMKFTNNSGSTITGLIMTENALWLDTNYHNTLKVVECTGENYTGGTFTFANLNASPSNSGWYYKLENIVLDNGEYIVFEWSTVMYNSNSYGEYSSNNYVTFYPLTASTPTQAIGGWGDTTNRDQYAYTSVQIPTTDKYLFSVKKTSTGSGDVSGKTASELEALTFSNTITITSDTSDTVDYTNKYI